VFVARLPRTGVGQCIKINKNKRLYIVFSIATTELHLQQTYRTQWCVIIIIGSSDLGGPWLPQANVASVLYLGHLPANFYTPMMYTKQKITYWESISGKLLVVYYLTWDKAVGTFFQETGRKFIGFIKSYKKFLNRTDHFENQSIDKRIKINSISNK